MKTPKNWSLRTKILSVMILLPLLVLLTYGALAMSIFASDKMAYIFETSHSASRALALQTKAQIESSLAKAIPIFQERITLQKFGPVSVGIFNSDPRLEWVGLFAPPSAGEDRFRTLDAFEKSSGQLQQDVQDWPGFQKFLRHVLQEGRGALTPWRDSHLLIAERLGDTSTLLFALLVKVQDLEQAFRTPSASRSYLVDSEGSILMGPADENFSQLDEILPDAGWKSVLSSNTSLTLKSSTQEEFLASFSKVNLAGLSVVSLVPKAQAFSAFRSLLKDSVVLIIFLLSCALIFGILASNQLTQALMELFSATKKVSEGHFDIQVPVASQDEIGSLAASFNTMAEEVQRLVLETAEKARMQSELKTAQTVQETLFPQAHAKVLGGEIFGFYEPATECGGDWWNHSVVNGNLYLWIGDATGHGAPAALITSATKSAATMIETMHLGPAASLTLLNRAIAEVSKGQMMMTFFLASVDPRTGLMKYSNASHEAPYLMRAGEKLTKKNLVPLNDVSDPRLGQSRDTIYSEKEIQLQAGDRILFFTDGIAEIPNPQSEPWGEREFIKALIRSNQSRGSLESSVSELISSWSEHRQKAHLADDVTLFLYEYQGPQGMDSGLADATA